VFTIQQNVSGGTISANCAVVWDTSSSADGVRVTTPVTSTLSSLVGLANAAIADSAYGLIQTYGYRATGVVVNHTSVAIVAGDILIPVTAVTYLARSTTATGLSGFVTAAYAVATGSATTVNAPVFLRCL
jgi:hypothetical protein